MASLGARIGFIPADLGGFRIHDASISGSGRLNEQYLRDCRRIFRQVRGRDWNRIDDLRHFVYRATGYMSCLAAR